MERLTHNHTEDTSELLSAYSDDMADIVERRRAEQYLARCAACAQELRELRMLKQILRDLPSVQPRRSFTIDPATVAAPRRFLFPTLRWASLVATALLLVLLGVDYLSAPDVMGPQGSAVLQRQADRSTTQEFAPLLASPAAAPMPDAVESPAAEMPAAEAAPENAPMVAMDASPEPEAERPNSGAAAAPSPEAEGPPLSATAAAPPAEPGSVDAAGAQQQPDAALKTPPAEALDTTDVAQGTEELAQLPAGNAADGIPTPPAWSGLRTAQLITALAALALGIAAWIAWRRQM